MRNQGHRARFAAGWATLTVVLTLAVYPIAGATPGPAPDDPDERADRLLVARRDVQENCLFCHGREMLESQRLTPKQWKTEVEKMVGWGSPLPADRQSDVIAYLSEEYAETAPPPKPGRVTYDKALASVAPLEDPVEKTRGNVERGGVLFQTQCANCHGADGQGADLGPNLVEKPVLRRHAEYDEFVRKGRGRMPGFATLLSARDESDLLAWVRARRYEPSDAKGK